MWRVKKFTHVPGTDLVLLGLQLATSIHASGKFHQAIVTARVPAIGEHVTFVGASAKKDFFAMDGTPEGEDAVMEVFLSRGTVTARYLPARDTVLLPWPCIEVDCATYGGMSGGPVFDVQGALVGVLCSSFETDGESKPSYASLIYPALVARYEGGRPESHFSGPQMLLKNEHCIIDRRDAFVGDISLDSDIVNLQFRYA
nr:serine protease [uncultured Duganella sp.]